jgi:septal ring factor EnvC (AmiA/AmiB activator)
VGLAQGIRKLAESLKDATIAVDAIRSEIEEGQRVLEKLEQDLAARRHASKLSEEEAASITYLLQQELARERRPAVLRDLVFLILGAGLGWLLQNGLPWVGG